MKKIICAVSATLLLATLQIPAKEQMPQNHRRGAERNMARHHNKIMQPVYAVKSGEKTTVVTPAQRADLEAARKRRFEIMMLIGAYKIMPVDQRQALKAELLKRIEADFHASVKMQKERIANAETELKRLRAELAEKEANADKLVERELERLLTIQIPSRRGPRPGKKDQQQLNKSK